MDSARAGYIDSYMTVFIEPEMSEPIPGKSLDMSTILPHMPAYVRAAVETIHMLSLHGMHIEDTEFTPEDRHVARTLSVSYAEDPEKVTKATTPARIGMLTPAALLLTDQILKEFGHQIVEDSVQLRYMVTNKLINETDSPDARIRLRALELLGKISDVGLFAEKSEVTITHRTSDELRERLRNRLQKLVDVTPTDVEEVIVSPIDIAKEVGVAPALPVEVEDV